jgi:hypothetical protein
VTLALVMLAGCSSNGGGGPSPYASLFDTPAGAKATPGTLDGVWIGTMPGRDAAGDLAETAAEFSGSTMTGATRCSFVDGTVMYAGVVVAVRVDTAAGIVTTLESKTDRETSGQHGCLAESLVGQNMYMITGTTMTVTGPAGMAQLVKVRD